MPKKIDKAAGRSGASAAAATEPASVYLQPGRTFWSPIEVMDDGSSSQSQNHVRDSVSCSSLGSTSLPALLEIHIMPMTVCPSFETEAAAVAYAAYLEQHSDACAMSAPAHGLDNDPACERQLCHFIGHTLASDCICDPELHDCAVDVPMYVHRMIQ